MNPNEPGIDPEIEQLFLRLDDDIVNRRNVPVKEHILARQRLVLEELKPQIEQILDRGEMHWMHMEDAGSYGALELSEPGRVVFSYSFSMWGEMVALFVHADCTDPPSGEQLDRVRRLLTDNGFVVIPYEQARYPYTGNQVAHTGELVREWAVEHDPGFDWARIFFDFQ